MCAHIQRVESPIRQLVSMEVMKEPVDVPFCLHTRSDLVADILMFDSYHNIFFYRTSFLWVQSHTPSIYSASMLAATGIEPGHLTLEFKSTGPHQSEIRSCVISVSLKRIVDQFARTAMKIPEVSQMLLEGVPSEDPLDAFL